MSSFTTCSIRTGFSTCYIASYAIIFAPASHSFNILPNLCRSPEMFFHWPSIRSFGTSWCFFGCFMNWSLLGGRFLLRRCLFFSWSFFSLKWCLFFGGSLFYRCYFSWGWFFTVSISCTCYITSNTIQITPTAHSFNCSPDSFRFIMVGFHRLFIRGQRTSSWSFLNRYFDCWGITLNGLSTSSMWGYSVASNIASDTIIIAPSSHSFNSFPNTCWPPKLFFHWLSIWCISTFFYTSTSVGWS